MALLGADGLEPGHQLEPEAAGESEGDVTVALAVDVAALDLQVGAVAPDPFDDSLDESTSSTTAPASLPPSAHGCSTPSIARWEPTAKAAGSDSPSPGKPLPAWAAA